MARIYTVQFDNVSVSAAQDLFEITPADDKPVDIVGLFLSQTGVADVGDAAEELLPVQIIRGFTTSGSAGSAPRTASSRACSSSVGSGQGRGLSCSSRAKWTRSSRAWTLSRMSRASK